MNRQLKLPQVNAYIRRLGRVNYCGLDTCYTYDEASYHLIDEIYKLVQQIAPTGQYGHRAFWIPVERGSLADFADSYGSFEEMREWDDVATEQEYETYWKAEFPEEIEWFHVVVTEEKDIDYRAIFINNEHVIEVDDRKSEKSYPHNISDFCQWLVDGIKGVIQELKEQTIGDNAFSGCSALTEIDLPSGVDTIGANVFQNCTSLKKVTLPDTLAQINGNPFRGCTSLAELVVNSDYFKVVDGVLYDATGYTLIYAPISTTGDIVMLDTVRWHRHRRVCHS